MSKLLVILLLATLAVVNVLAVADCPDDGCKCGQWVGQFCGKRANKVYTTDKKITYGPVLKGNGCKPEAIYQCGANHEDFEASYNSQCFTCDADVNKPGVDRCVNTFRNKDL
ncbi:uncharacterized protein LOC128956167 [Oppia nitens]|uniref:uncharacterized protein LOC128956167 n=1 Tax=Oppia nitens TaxID=1686743 RepID=UPI0023DB809A|nr:uncharacterized protein LOC128956167 [Oppia nitens]